MYFRHVQLYSNFSNFILISFDVDVLYSHFQLVRVLEIQISLVSYKLIISLISYKLVTLVTNYVTNYQHQLYKVQCIHVKIDLLIFNIMQSNIQVLFLHFFYVGLDLNCFLVSCYSNCGFKTSFSSNGLRSLKQVVRGLNFDSCV